MRTLGAEYRQLAEEPEEHYRMPDAFLDEQRQKLNRAKKESVLADPANLLTCLDFHQWVGKWKKVITGRRLSMKMKAANNV